MKKKVVSVALAAAMTAGVLAGCGGGSSKETTKASEADKTETKAVGKFDQTEAIVC